MGSRKILTPLLIGALTVAALLVVALGIQNRSLRADVDALRERATEPYAGFTVPSFRSVSLERDSIRLGDPAPGTRQVLLVFNTTCSVCLQTLPAWQVLARQLASSGEAPVLVYGISLDDEEQTRRYVAENALRFPVARFPDARLPELYRVVAVPLTLVIGEGGVIEHARFGALTTPGALDSVLLATKGRPGPMAGNRR